MQKIFFSIITIFLTCITSTGNAQLYFTGRTLSTANGLSDNRITAIYKDQTGYIWIGTKNGLNRFDGFSFTIFKPQKGNSISNEIINCITGDTEGNIWVGTMSGLNKYNPVTNQWTNWVPGTQLPTHNTLHNFLIWDIEFDGTGKLWIACDVKEFTCYNPTTNTFSYYDWPAFVKTISGSITPAGYHAIQSFARKNREEFWLASNKGLVHLNTRTKQFTYLGNYYQDIVDLQYDSLSQQLWISLEGGAVFHYNARQKTYQQVNPVAEPYPSTSFPKISAEEIWIASEKGLLRAAPSSAAILLHQHNPSISSSLPPGGVTTTYKDNTGMYWIGTPNGIFLLNQTTPGSYFIPLLSASDKEGTNRMGEVLYDETDSLYYVCAIQPAALFILSKKDGSIRKIQTDQQGNKLSACYAVKKILGQYWLLTEDKIYQIKQPNQLLRHFPTPHDGPTTVFRDMETDPLNRIWISSFNKGILLYDTPKNRFSTIQDPLAAFLQTAGTGLQYDSVKKKIWIATYGNYLFAYDLTTNALVPYNENENHAPYNALNLINDLTMDHNGNLWVATNAGGIFRNNSGNGHNNSFTEFDMRKGMQHNQFFSIRPGEENTLWLLSETGLSYIDARHPEKEQLVKDIQQVSNFGSDPRHPHTLFYNQKDKEILIAAAGGLIFYYPHPVKRIDSFPLLVKQLPNATASFTYDGLYYGNDPVQYEYFLEGWTKNWTAAGMERTIHFHQLPPGNYIFSLRAKDQQGNILTSSTALPLLISPPLWKNSWFILFSFLLIGWIIFKIIHSLQQKVKDEKILNQFATSLYGKTSIDDIFWDVANNCILLLGFEDCVIYLYNQEKKVMIQRAAAGPKSPHTSREIINHLEIPVGKGIVGTVARTGKAERIGNTAADHRYVVDDKRRNAEITIPIWVDGRLFGIIDSEHSRRYFFKARHSRMLKNIATICGERISKYLTEERLRSKISRDLHDEMGSALTSINILSTVAMAKEEKKEEVQEYLQKIKAHSGNMMESMSDMIWAINPANDSLEKVLIKMKEFAAEMLEPSGINYHFETSGFTQQSVLNLEERKDLYLVFKEAVTNIAKYACATAVTISLKFDKEELQLRIRDNGKGFDTNKEDTGNGLSNMRARARAMGAEFTLESVAGTGTTIMLKKHIT
ncbi:two-component regulator propeller domain-containing protein [Flavihumibacter sp. CACIAM 22H1]|uniref:sensor histidine kinase n=1 Tax=Flavihumibacter sp. CACIAM 22H1 TaxID=1812911 RepID=UPI0007A87295|nr:two-component regulator propeller domain-containing protein [Flavihumibacter sp. CACIAM 22H1]KYP14463.1 MAG: hypothetical protein A1D16_18105 [Flavihumibacter sp. CACIAM 22H1]